MSIGVVFFARMGACGIVGVTVDTGELVGVTAGSFTAGRFLM